MSEVITIALLSPGQVHFYLLGSLSLSVTKLTSKEEKMFRLEHLTIFKFTVANILIRYSAM